jgi:phage gpG-like protein
MQIQFRVSGIQSIRTQLQKTRLAIEQGQFLAQISQIVGESIVRNYQAQGRPRWPERSVRYNRTHTNPILDLTGRKRDTEEQSARNGTWIRRRRGWVLQIMTPDYGYAHQYGKGRQKVRKSVLLHPDEIQRILDLLRSYPLRLQE